MVDLPEPDGPSSASISPSRTSRLMSSSTITGSPPSAARYDFEVCRSSTSGAASVATPGATPDCGRLESNISADIHHSECLRDLSPATDVNRRSIEFVSAFGQVIESAPEDAVDDD